MLPGRATISDGFDQQQDVVAQEEQSWCLVGRGTGPIQGRAAVLSSLRAPVGLTTRCAALWYSHQMRHQVGVPVEPALWH